MRGAAIGFLSLLLGVAIMLYLLAGRGCAPGGRSYLQTVGDAKKKYEPIAQQMGGKDPQGVPFHESMTTTAWPETGGSFRGVEVKTVDPAGVAATFYGLKTGDVIRRIGPQDIGGYIITDEQAAQDMLDDAFARSFPLTVERGGATIQLPDPTRPPPTGPLNPPAMPGAPPAPGTPVTPPAPSQVPLLPFPTPQ